MPLFVIADMIRNPVHPTAWMPDPVRHDNGISAFTVSLSSRPATRFLMVVNGSCAAVTVIRNACQIFSSIQNIVPESTLVPRQVCQNIDIRLTRWKNSTNKAASHFQQDLMTNLWSSVQLIYRAHFVALDITLNSAMRPHQLIVLPALIGGAAMAWAIHRSNFLDVSGATSFLWTSALLGPFMFVGVVAWRSRQGLLPAALAVLPALLLAGSPAACIAVDFDEGCGYILALSPIYLWAVVAVAAVLEIASRRRSFSEVV